VINPINKDKQNFQHMKYAILFLLIPFFAFGQREATSDSTYLQWYPDGWYRILITKYDAGPPTVTPQFIGDTSTMYNQIVDEIRNATASRAVDANYVSGFPKANRQLIDLSDEVLAKAGKSPVDSIENTDASVFLQDGWVIKTPNETIPITFNQTNAKKLRYQFVTTTNKQVDLMGAVIRLRDYPASGQTTDFYRSPNGRRWVDATKTNQLIPPGGTANK